MNSLPLRIATSYVPRRDDQGPMEPQTPSDLEAVEALRSTLSKRMTEDDVLSL